MKCYAASIGGCSTTQSVEHYVPQGLWQSEIITYEGFDWLNGESRQLPVKSVAANILCSRHNSDLSFLDSELQRFFRTLSDFHETQFSRSHLKRSAIWKTDRADFDGRIIERALTKMAIGISCNKPDTNWHLDGAKWNKPPIPIINGLFGKSDFNYPMGLFNVNEVGDEVFNREAISVQTMIHPETQGYVGAVIGIRDCQFFINLSEIDFAQNSMGFQSLTGKLFGFGGASPAYHLSEFKFQAGSKISGIIRFEW